MRHQQAPRSRKKNYSLKNFTVLFFFFNRKFPHKKGNIEKKNKQTNKQTKNLRHLEKIAGLKTKRYSDSSSALTVIAASVKSCNLEGYYLLG